jgi:hypothetical protein
VPITEFVPDVPAALEEAPAPPAPTVMVYTVLEENAVVPVNNPPAPPPPPML